MIRCNLPGPRVVLDRLSKSCQDSSGQYFTFQNDENEDNELTSEDVIQMSEVRARGATQPKPPEQPTLFTERSVRPGDTLQNLSIQYGCPVRCELSTMHFGVRLLHWYTLRVLCLYLC